MRHFSPQSTTFAGDHQHKRSTARLGRSEKRRKPSASPLQRETVQIETAIYLGATARDAAARTAIEFGEWRRWFGG